MTLLGQYEELLEVRAIRLPKAKIVETARSMVAALLRALKGEDQSAPIPDSFDPVSAGAWELEIPGVAGSSKYVFLALERGPGGASLFNGAVYRPARGVIMVSVNLNRSPASLKSVEKLAVKWLTSTLMHETTHVADVITRAAVERVKKAMRKHALKGIVGNIGGYREYLNWPHEIRAHLQQVVLEVLEAIDRMPKLMTLFKGGQSIKILLNRSDTWTEIEDHLSAKNRRRIMKAVVRELQDAGIIESVQYG